MSSKDKPPFKVTVSAALDALHAALTHEVHCQYFLQGKHDLHMSNLVKAAAQPIDSDLSMHAVIDNMEGYLSAQLTAAACVMRLCLSEIEQREEVGKQTSLDMGRYCLRALNEGWFGSIVRVMRLAIKVILRAMLGMVRLYSRSLCHVFWLGCARRLRQGCTVFIPSHNYWLSCEAASASSWCAVS